MNKVIAAALLVIGATTVQAEGLYLGIGYGSVEAKDTVYSYTSSNVMGLIGYEINDAFSIEAETSSPVSKDTITIGITAVKIGMKHTAVYLKYSMPLDGTFIPFVRIGSSTGTASATAGATTVSVDDSAFSWGIGGEYKMSETIGVRFDYSAADYGATDGTVTGITFVNRF